LTVDKVIAIIVRVKFFVPHRGAPDPEFCYPAGSWPDPDMSDPVESGSEPDPIAWIGQIRIQTRPISTTADNRRKFTLFAPPLEETGMTVYPFCDRTST